MNHQAQYSHATTFRKIAIFTIPILVVILWRLGYFKQETTQEVPESQAIERVREETTALAELCWNHVFNPTIQSMDSLAIRIWKSQGNVEDNIRNWVNSDVTRLSCSVWLINEKWPARYVNDAIWKENDIKALNSEDKKMLLNFLFKEESYRDKKQYKYYLGPYLNLNALESPMLTIGLVTNSMRKVEMIETKVKCLSFIQQINQQLGAKGNWAITNEKGEFLFSSSDSLFNQISVQGNQVQMLSKTIYARAPIAESGWILHYIQEKPQPQYAEKFNHTQFLYTVSGLGLIALLWAYLLARWIDKPVNRILLMASEIARGDFSIRIPMPKSKRLVHLATLINYMADETERLLEMNVGGIISEKRKTETILRNIADGVLVTDPQNQLIVINTVAEKWFGIKQKAVFNKPISKIIRNKHLMHLLERLSYTEQKSSIEFGFTIQGENHERIFHAHASQVYDENNQLIGTVTILRDITKEHEADKLKTELVSMVAHELKSPMTSIFGFSELLLENDLTDEQRKEYANVIMTESSRLTDLINKFLDLTRLEAGRTEIKMIPFDLPQMVDKMLENSKSLIKKKNMSIVTDFSAQLPFAFGDPDMIEQVLLNLISNAIKYSPQNSKIGIEIKESDKRLFVSVVDNGYGIPKEALPNIFNKFYRVAGTDETAAAEGSGLGLALAKEIVQHHGGTIDVQSKLGVGSVFTFSVAQADISGI